MKAFRRETVDWEAVYWQQTPRIYNFFRYRLNGDNHAAQDLTSITLEKAWRFRQQYRSDLGAFEAWLFTIARHVAADYLRQPIHDLPLEWIEDIPAPDSPETELLWQETTTSLNQLLQRLPPRHQELIALKYGADLNNRAIARITGISESNVGTLLHRIILKLRSEWEKVYE
ncbi:MAG: sigma-70 family RNA polymerase sigma factor [Anaerolineae bacterium]